MWLAVAQHVEQDLDMLAAVQRDGVGSPLDAMKAFRQGHRAARLDTVNPVSNTYHLVHYMITSGKIAP